MKKLTSILLSLIVCFVLVGCGPKNPLFGKWTTNIDGHVAIVEISENKFVMKADGMEQAFDLEIQPGIFVLSILDESEEMYYTLNGDGSLTLEMNGDAITFYK